MGMPNVIQSKSCTKRTRGFDIGRFLFRMTITTGTLEKTSWIAKTRTREYSASEDSVVVD